MKTRVTIMGMFVAIMLIPALSTTSIAQVAIMNPAFEDSTDRDANRESWRNKALEADADTVIGDGSWVLQMSTTNNTDGGQYSGKLPTGTSETSNRRWLYQEVTVEANTDYEISWFMKQSAGNTLTVAIYDTVFNTVSVIGDSQYILKTQDYNDGSGSNTGSFIEQSIAFNSGDNTEIVLFISNDWENGSSSANVDDFSIKEVVSTPPPPSIGVIINPSFEDSTDRDANRESWRNKALEADADTVIGDGSWVLQMSTSNNTPEGQFSGKLPTGTSETSNRRWMYQSIAVKVNTDYEISWFMKQSAGNTLNVAIYDTVFSTVSVIGDSQYIIESQEYNDASGSNTGSYVEQSIAFNSGDNTVIVLFISNDWENGSSSVNVDDFSMKEALPEPPAPGIILNPAFEDSTVRDANREVWRNKALEADADTVIGDGSWVLQMSTTNNTDGGQYSGKLPTGTSETSNRRWMYQALSVDSFTSYTISWFMKQDAGNTLKVALYDTVFSTVSVIDDSQYIIKSQEYNDASASNTGSFIEQSITFDSGDNTEVVLFISNDWENGNGSVNIDDFSVANNGVTISNEIDDSIDSFKLNQNYPNPFNPSTEISFTMPYASDVSIEVFNMLGQKVVTLFNGRKAAGAHNVTFNASHLSSGIYLYQLKAGPFVQIKRMTLIK